MRRRAKNVIAIVVTLIAAETAAGIALAADAVECETLRVTNPARYQRDCVKPKPKPSPQPTPTVRPQPRPTSTAVASLLTVVNDRAALAKLRRVWGVSLQWVDMSTTSAQYGRARAFQRGGYMHITGDHRSPAQGASLTIDGDVIRIDKTTFVLRGTISVINAPADQPNCTVSRDFVFEEYGYGRKYWRLNGELCANRRVADDVDIYY